MKKLTEGQKENLRVWCEKLGCNFEDAERRHLASIKKTETVSVEISIPVHVSPAPRPRARCIKPWKAILWDPGKKAKAEIRKLIIGKLDDEWPKDGVDGAVRMRCTIVRRVPKSWPKYKRALALSGILKPEGPPDLDNLEKTVMDACNGVIWADDSQIVWKRAIKKYGPKDRLILSIKAVNGTGVIRKRRKRKNAG